MKINLARWPMDIGLGVALLFAGGCQSTEHAKASSAQTKYPSVSTEASQAAMSPQDALVRLRDGNARFVAGLSQARNFPAEVRATATGQYPFAVILSCLDSRQPNEIIFDQGLGDIFSARVAGNVLNPDILGSMEFACKLSGAKLIAVVGHSNCGAIKGAIDDVQLGNLTSLLGRLQPAIAQVPHQGKPPTSKDHAFVEEVAEKNVRLVMGQIREQSPVLREMLDSGKIGLVGGIYDLTSGETHFFPN